MPIGGKLTLKGGQPWDIKKKKKRKAKAVVEETAEEGTDPGTTAQTGTAPDPAAPAAVPPRKALPYEEEFALEMEKVKTGKVKTTPWGSSSRAPPPILHGYSAPVTGKTAQERLDLRCASRTDKFCK
ncbi:hypothetical protein WJX72_002823 [[Myrmecia] bisecta]|uniref:Uncharacterized protein n=1 Tax=[Myrmecia] bisecta TaxID=41462 RepID=A0AAW1QEJ1_9CHLO